MELPLNQGIFFAICFNSQYAGSTGRRSIFVQIIHMGGRHVSSMVSICLADHLVKRRVV